VVEVPTGGTRYLSDAGIPHVVRNDTATWRERAEDKNNSNGKRKNNSNGKRKNNGNDKRKNNSNGKHKSNGNDRRKSNGNDKRKSNGNDKRKNNSNGKHKSNGNDRRKSNSNGKHKNNSNGKRDSNGNSKLCGEGEFASQLIAEKHRREAGAPERFLISLCRRGGRGDCEIEISSGGRAKRDGGARIISELVEATRR